MWVNGQRATGLDIVTGTIDVSELLQPGTNTIEVEVSSTLKNRMVDINYPGVNPTGRTLDDLLTNGYVGRPGLRMPVADYGMTGEVSLVTYARAIAGVEPVICTVTFNANGGEPVPGRQTVTEGGKAEKPADPSKAGHTFGGWYTDNGTFANAWDFETDTVTADITLYAKWEKIPGSHASYVEGYPEGTFRPENSITRAEATALVVRTLLAEYDKNVSKTPTFKDVDAALWSAPYIGWAQEYNLVEGYGDDTFRPEAPITREEMMAIVARTGEVLKAKPMSFIDVDKVSPWALDYVYTCVENGWVEGDNENRLRPVDNITRAEMVAILNRMLDRDDIKAESIAGVQDDLNIFTDTTDKSKWWYYHILEASNDHTYNVSESGLEIWVSVP